MIVQVFCLYHAYKNRADQKWLWFIIIFPMLGAAIYLYDYFYNRENISTIKDTVNVAMNSNYRVEQLEKEVKFSNSILNRSNLADAYVDLERYEEAIELYESCLTDFNAKNVEITKKLVSCYYQVSNHASAVEFGTKIEGEKVFRNSTDRIAYAWSLYEMNELDRAEKNFIGMDGRYCNYTHREEFAKFLHLTNRHSEAIEKLEELLSELDKMNSSELRPWRSNQRSIRELLGEYRSPN